MGSPQLHIQAALFPSARAEPILPSKKWSGIVRSRRLAIKTYGGFCASCGGEFGAVRCHAAAQFPNCLQVLRDRHATPLKVESTVMPHSSSSHSGT